MDPKSLEFRLGEMSSSLSTHGEALTELKSDTSEIKNTLVDIKGNLAYHIHRTDLLETSMQNTNNKVLGLDKIYNKWNTIIWLTLKILGVITFLLTTIVEVYRGIKGG
jgi:hypothetical protein